MQACRYFSIRRARLQRSAWVILLHVAVYIYIAYAKISLMSSHYSFARNLVKGRIAETVFAEMLRETEKFTVLEFGYEKVVPELLARRGGRDSPVIETLRAAPDFAVINLESKEVKLIEVKYRAHMTPLNTLQCASRMHAAWNPSYLFIATKGGFYFDEVGKIIKNGGHISPLEYPFIPKDLQRRYLQILRDFEYEEM